MDVKILVGLNIQRLRREKGVSQEELSLLADTTRGYLSGIENGKRNPTIGFLSTVADALGAELQDLLALPPRKKRNSG
jgi:transcriptional regulator with XRE-family HTH domain